MTHPDLTRLVHKLARRYSWCGADMDDLVAEGFLGLTIATDRFDPERGVKFITYAHHWIRGKVQKAADKHIKVNTATGSLDAPDRNGKAQHERIGSEALSIADEGPSGRSAENSAAIQLLVATMAPRERLILGRRFGFEGPVHDPSRAAHVKEARRQLAELKR